MKYSYAAIIADQERRVAAKRAHDDDVLSRVVSRDPCPRCAVRADIHDQFGCGVSR